MPSVAEQYAREIKRGLEYNATWLPGDELKLGHVGEVQDGIFVPQDTIKHLLDLDLHPEPNAHEGFSLTYQSHAGVSLAAKAKGETSTLFQHIGKAQAGISVTFQNQGACVFSVPRYRIQRAGSQITFRRQLLDRIDDSWQENWAIVTEIVLAESATILVSHESSAKVEISAAADIQNPLADVGRADIGLAVAHTHGHVLSIVAEQGLTPLFRAIRVKRGWFGRVSTGTLGDEVRRDPSAMSDAEIDGVFEDLT